MSFTLSNPVITTIISGIAILFTIITHECAHGFVALLNGDATAKEAGRLTLNPLSHLDFIGTICLFFFRFGWAKPVPINPSRFRDERLGMVTTSLAGVTMNLLCAFLAVVVSRWIPFNWLIIQLLLMEITVYGISFCVFNLLPIPPLDGSKIILAFLPRDLQFQVYRFEHLTRWVLPILVFSGLFSQFANPIVSNIFNGMYAFVYEIF